MVQVQVSPMSIARDIVQDNGFDESDFTMDGQTAADFFNFRVWRAVRAYVARLSNPEIIELYREYVSSDVPEQAMDTVWARAHCWGLKKAVETVVIAAIFGVVLERSEVDEVYG